MESQKIILKDLVNSDASLQSLFTCRELSVKISYRLSKLIRKITTELQDFYEARTKLFNQYGETDEEGRITIPSKNVGVFQEEIDSILDEEIELQFIKVSLSDIPDGVLHALDYFNLEWLIDESDLEE
ncbi:hypothetical protein LCGC14_0609620 [marine sediment metagenome]|uniref:Uncharacterized protein n=1 Tax=marine sediment metagenome TaxID=412755 RepID=A0A0F9R859_9ZZZZ